ncbi:MAG: proton-conducting transporter membrane subunit, partial [Thermoplasmata archaeon]
NDVNRYVGIGLILAILAVVTMFIGNIIALVQTDIKRMLAYSSIVQMGYIILGLGLALYAFGNNRDPTFGIQGGLFHILTHAFMKGLAFLAAGAFIHAAGTRDMRQMKGLGNKMPITAAAFVIAALSLAGVPPLAGFMSKWLIFRAGIDAGLPIFTAFAILNSILSLGYYIPAINKLYSIPDANLKGILARAHEASPLMIFAIAVMAGFTIVLGILPGLGLNLVEPAAIFVRSVLENGY